MNIDLVKTSDVADWLALAEEAEPLFGAMVSDVNFHKAIYDAIAEKRAFCIREENNLSDKPLCGIIVVSTEDNEILWLAVADKHKRKGCGELLLRYALRRLSADKPVSVQTFDGETKEGIPARKLYMKMGFKETSKAGLNPAGLPTVIFKKNAVSP